MMVVWSLLQCVYASGHCLHLLSCHTSPDPQLQWRATGTGETMSLTGGHYSTLSTVMRKEESNQAEVSTLGELSLDLFSV